MTQGVQKVLLQFAENVEMHFHNFDLLTGVEHAGKSDFGISFLRTIEKRSGTSYRLRAHR